METIVGMAELVESCFKYADINTHGLPDRR